MNLSDFNKPNLVGLNPHLFNPPARQAVSGTGVEREADLHEDIFAECRRRGWIPLHGAMSERTHRTTGESDFVILADNGGLFLVECKTRTGKLSTAQQALKAHAEKLGHVVHVVRSMDEFLNVVRKETNELHT